MPSSIRPRSCGRTSGRTPSTRPCWNSPGGLAGSDADARPRLFRDELMLRQRAISAALLIPPLLIVLLLGGTWIVALVVVATVLAAVEVFRLLAAAGYASIPALGVALAVAIVLD